MVLNYKIIISRKAKRDINNISEYLKDYNSEKILRQIDKDIEELKYMPRINKTLYFSKDFNGEYRRKISGKYIIIYKIIKDKIIITRIFNQKQNYLNSKNFILREKSQIYKITKLKI